MIKRTTRYSVHTSRCNKVAVILLLLLYLLSACTEDNSQTELKVRIGRSFPALSVKDLNGKPHELRFDQGKVTVLNIWATWCGPCRHEMPSLQRLADQLGEKYFQVIGVSVDADDHVMREFLIDKKLRFPNARGPNSSDPLNHATIL